MWCFWKLSACLLRPSSWCSHDSKSDVFEAAEDGRCALFATGSFSSVAAAQYYQCNSGGVLQLSCPLLRLARCNWCAGTQAFERSSRSVAVGCCNQLVSLQADPAVCGRGEVRRWLLQGGFSGWMATASGPALAAAGAWLALAGTGWQLSQSRCLEAILRLSSPTASRASNSLCP